MSCIPPLVINEYHVLVYDLLANRRSLWCCTSFRHWTYCLCRCQNSSTCGWCQQLLLGWYIVWECTSQRFRWQLLESLVRLCFSYVSQIGTKKFFRDRRSLGSSPKPSGVLVGHTEGITYVSAKGDGRYVVSNGKDQAMRLWDLRKMRSNGEYERTAHIEYGVPNFDYRSISSTYFETCTHVASILDILAIPGLDTKPILWIVVSWHTEGIRCSWRSFVAISPLRKQRGDNISIRVLQMEGSM